MDLFIGYGGLAVSFLIFAVLFLLILIKANNISFKAKMIMVPLILAYSIVLYSTVQNFLGHPTPTTKGMNQVIILDYHVVEGDAFYFWVLDFNRKNAVATYLPNPPESMKPDAPIYVVIKYNSDLHKRLVEIYLELKKQERGGVKADLEMLKGFGSFSTDEVRPFKLYDPAKMLRKLPE